jgi:hypothetical protein
MFETSTTKVFALDIEGVDLGAGKISVETTSGTIIESPPDTTDGSLASVSIDATAEGANTFVGVESAVLAIDDFSDATASVIVAADTPLDGILLV